MMVNISVVWMRTVITNVSVKHVLKFTLAR